LGGRGRAVGRHCSATQDNLRDLYKCDLSKKTVKKGGKAGQKRKQPKRELPGQEKKEVIGKRGKNTDVEKMTHRRHKMWKILPQ